MLHCIEATLATAGNRSQLHASCVARGGFGVLLLGASGAGKSDLALRLIDRGFTLVADDRVDLAELEATSPPALAGLLEVRGLGIMRLPWTRRARLVLAVTLDPSTTRLPEPAQHPLGIPLLTVDPRPASAPVLVTLALDCVLGHVRQIAGAFAPAEPAP